MAGRRGGAPGGVIRTYARLRPLRRVEAQKWFSPEDRKHLFSSSSSSLLDSTYDASSSEDPDFILSKRKGSSSSREINPRPKQRTISKRKKKSLEPPRRSRRKISPSAPSTSDEKENDERLLPSSDIILSTPFRRFVTVRRKAPGPGVTMKPVSSKPRREARPLLSPDSCDFEADCLTLKKRRKRRRRMCTDVTSFLSSPLQKPPLLSSTPSMMLTAVPRKGNTFVRQLALCEPLEDSVVLGGADSDCCVVSPRRVSHEERSIKASASSGGLTKDKVHSQTTGANSVDKEMSRYGAGSGVKRLIITASSDRTLTPLLSPVTVSSPHSQSVVFIGEEKVKSHLQEHSNVFGASAELFSGDFTLDKEDMTPAHQDEHQTRCSRPTVTGGEVTGGRLSAPGSNNRRHFNRKQFQPFVRLNSQMVTEYIKQKSPNLLNKSSNQCDIETSDVPDLSGDTAPTMDPCMNRLQPVVSLDSAVVAKYFLQKAEASRDLENMDPLPQSEASRDLENMHPLPKSEESRDLENMDPLPQSEASAVLTLSCFSAVTKTPHITSSVLKNKMQNSAAPQTIGTGRKVCISGFSAKRWGTVRKKQATKAQQQLSFLDRSREDLCVGDAHSPSLLFSSSLLTSSFMNSTAVMNLNLSTESLTGRDPQKEHQRWARLRAALSLHRRKKVEAGSQSMCPAERRTQGKMSLSAHNSSLLLLSPFGSSLCTQELTDAEKVFAECQQERPVPFHECLTPDQLSRCQKVGEGVYGEVFRTLRRGQHVALKVIPIEGPQKVNGENQKSFAEILPEIIISKELSLLNEGENNQTSGFIQLHSAHCVRGSYPPELLSAWDQFGEEKGTENERPDLFGPEQLFMILEFEFGGEDLERMSSRLPSVAASRSILHQVTAALAVAEEELRFEHRDLHWGNLLIEKSPSCTMSVSLGGEIFDVPNAGIQVKIIDYTLSRLDKDGLTVFCDLSTDEELFLGEGDLQFDVYRQMRQENQNAWSSYRPHSNVLWLHYLCDKLLGEVKYIRKPTSAPQRRELRRLQDFRREVQQFGSATEVLKRSRLFK